MRKILNNTTYRIEEMGHAHFVVQQKIGTMWFALTWGHPSLEQAEAWLQEYTEKMQGVRDSNPSSY